MIEVMFREEKRQFTHDYEPFGVELEPFGNDTTDNKYRFTGQERDHSTNFDYMHFRFYASSMGRFLKPDNLIGTIANPQSWNLYSYVNGNPVNFNDPTGHQGEDSAKLPQSGGDPQASQQAQQQIKEEQTGNKDTENKPPEGALTEEQQKIAQQITSGQFSIVEYIQTAREEREKEGTVMTSAETPTIPAQETKKTGKTALAKFIQLNLEQSGQSEVLTFMAIGATAGAKKHPVAALVGLAVGFVVGEIKLAAEAHSTNVPESQKEIMQQKGLGQYGKNKVEVVPPDQDDQWKKI